MSDRVHRRLLLPVSPGLMADFDRGSALRHAQAALRSRRADTEIRDAAMAIQRGGLLVVVVAPPEAEVSDADLGDDLRAAFGIGSGIVIRGPGTDSMHGAPPRPRERRLKCEFQENVRIGEAFGVIVRIALRGDGTVLKSFPVPPQGRDVLLDIKATGLLTLGSYQQTVRVPPDRDSEPVMFELRAEEPGRAEILVTAWLDGNYLGEVKAEVLAYPQDPPVRRDRSASSELSTNTTEGAVSLLVRYDPRDNMYRFQFVGAGNPREELVPLSWPPTPAIEALIGRMEETASGEAGHSVAETRNSLIDEGAELWRQILPEPLRRHFWAHRDDIRRLTILGEKDTVPWELMYPKDKGHDAGAFLVEQFAVTRDVFNRPGLARAFDPRPARLVLPPGSPPCASGEVEFLRGLLAAGPTSEAVLSDFTAVRELVIGGDFGLLHFACHNHFESNLGSSIGLTGGPFRPTNLQSAEIDETLKPSAPLVFINACRSAGAAPRYNDLSGWAETFLRAGAGAFIGSLWAVNDRHSAVFSEHFYRVLKEGKTLGEAAAAAREEIRRKSRGANPTWLAYTIYGDPLARLL
jgi:hypothetical protein